MQDYGQECKPVQLKRSRAEREEVEKELGSSHEESSMQRSMSLRTINLIVILKMSWSDKGLDSRKPDNKP